MKQNKIYIYTDGGSRGNPGPAAIGITIYDENKQLLGEHKECIGETTNNVAEYKALTKALELGAAHCRNEICCFLDSELVVRCALHDHLLSGESPLSPITYSGE